MDWIYSNGHFVVIGHILISWLVYTVQMRTNLLTSTQYGKYYPTQITNELTTIQLDKIQDIKQSALTIHHQRLYLLDADGHLSCLNLNEQTLSTLSNHKLQYFHPDSRNSLSLTAISPTSQILKIKFQNKEVERVFNPCLNSLIGFEKNYLTETILLLQPKLLVLVDSNKKIKSLKTTGNNLFESACLLGINSYCCVLLRSGVVQIYETSSLKLVDSIKLPFGCNEMKVVAGTKGKHIAIYGNNCWLFLLQFDKKLQCKLCELPLQFVIELQYTYAGEIVLLGSDRILYGLQFGSQVSLRPIFNQDNSYIPTGFDVSVDEKLLVVVAGKAIHLLNCRQGLKKTIEQAEGGTVLNFSELANNTKILHVNKQIVDEKVGEYGESRKEKGVERQAKAKQIKQHSDYDENQYQQSSSQQDAQKEQQIGSQPSIERQDNSSSQSLAHKIYEYLTKFKQLTPILTQFEEQTISFINKLYQKTNKPEMCSQLSLEILLKITDICSSNRLEKLALGLAPRTLQQCRSYGISVNSFVTELVLGLFEDYFPSKNADQLWKKFTSNLSKERFCETFLILLLNKIYQQGNSSENKQQISLKTLQGQVNKALSSPKATQPQTKVSKQVKVTQKVAVVKKSEKQGGQSLQVLLARQQKIKSGLKKIRLEIDKK